MLSRNIFLSTSFYPVFSPSIIVYILFALHQPPSHPFAHTIPCSTWCWKMQLDATQTHRLTHARALGWDGWGGGDGKCFNDRAADSIKPRSVISTLHVHSRAGMATTARDARPGDKNSANERHKEKNKNVAERRGRRYFYLCLVLQVVARAPVCSAMYHRDKLQDILGDRQGDRVHRQDRDGEMG